MHEIYLHTRQPVLWPPAPSGVAQVEELLRTRVRLFYCTKSGKPRRPVVHASRVHIAHDFLFDNPYGRAARARAKTFRWENTDAVR